MSWKERMFALPWWKSIGETLAITTFMVVYIWVMRNPLFPVRVVPVTMPDLWTPLLPWTAWIYFSLWVYICLPTTLMGTKAVLRHYFLGALLMAIVGLGVFVGYPTAAPLWDVDWSQYPGWFSFLKTEELSGNACPSMHVSYTVFACLWSATLLRVVKAASWVHVVNVLWALAILVSTMTTRQHVFIDVAFGTLLGSLIFAINMYCVRRERVAL
ncbi:phosphatase PAP2 family protein [Cerasicoccus fimbriatus]|uniref:phosphatase PAP2 family protein n=1 Tax=Cerasicoccus fimbriatus TaxID=3014554 RepID=UPI0022B395E4|nr:phosphatase PAP2 family protein [Cerasicoccus sp. TK19100]